MSNNGDGRKRSSFRDQVERERAAARESGAIHQAGGGTGLNEFFSKDNRFKPLTRGDLFGLLQLIEYSRRESSFARVLWRWLTRRPGPMNLPGMLAFRYQKTTLEPALAALQAQLDKEAKDAAASGAATSSPIVTEPR